MERELRKCTQLPLQSNLLKKSKKKTENGRAHEEKKTNRKQIENKRDTKQARGPVKSAGRRGTLGGEGEPI